ncbi:glutaredoxin domain-containing protein [Anaerofustis sp.]|uniref:glutaredoxin domain-containing protein n=1 Tax=Anaerofustis sp. TaxID=1872517 RepID=UPI0025B87B93|nr:glutaredoxin domain-containing protein [Anaerofustis sp.]
MSRVTIYTTKTCPYCKMAKELLTQKGIDFEERILEFGSEELTELVKKTHHRTVPQIFFGEEFIGGYDDLQKYLTTKEFIEK